MAGAASGAAAAIAPSTNPPVVNPPAVVDAAAVAQAKVYQTYLERLERRSDAVLVLLRQFLSDYNRLSRPPGQLPPVPGKDKKAKGGKKEDDKKGKKKKKKSTDPAAERMEVVRALQLEAWVAFVDKLGLKLGGKNSILSPEDVWYAAGRLSDVELSSLEGCFRVTSDAWALKNLDEKVIQYWYMTMGVISSFSYKARPQAERDAWVSQMAANATANAAAAAAYAAATAAAEEKAAAAAAAEAQPAAGGLPVPAVAPKGSDIAEKHSTGGQLR